MNLTSSSEIEKYSKLHNDKMVLEVDEVLFEEEPHEFGFTLRFAQKSNRK